MTMSKSVYLELDDLISFKEFVISMRKGSLQNQIRKQAMDHYGDFPDLGTITVCKFEIGPLEKVDGSNIKLNGRLDRQLLAVHFRVTVYFRSFGPSALIQSL